MKGIISGWLTTTARARAKDAATPLPAIDAGTTATTGPTTGTTTGPIEAPGPTTAIVDPFGNGLVRLPHHPPASVVTRGRPHLQARPVGGPEVRPGPVEDPAPPLRKSERREGRNRLPSLGACPPSPFTTLSP